MCPPLLLAAIPAITASLASAGSAAAGAGAAVGSAAAAAGSAAASAAGTAIGTVGSAVANLAVGGLSGTAGSSTLFGLTLGEGLQLGTALAGVAASGKQGAEAREQAAAQKNAAQRQARFAEAQAMGELNQATAVAAAKGEEISIQEAEAAGKLKAFGIGIADRTLASLLARRVGAEAARNLGRVGEQQMFAREAAAERRTGAGIQLAGNIANIVKPSRSGLGLGIGAQAASGAADLYDTRSLR